MALYLICLTQLLQHPQLLSALHSCSLFMYKQLKKARRFQPGESFKCCLSVTALTQIPVLHLTTFKLYMFLESFYKSGIFLIFTPLNSWAQQLLWEWGALAAWVNSRMCPTPNWWSKTSKAQKATWSWIRYQLDWTSAEISQTNPIYTLKTTSGPKL